jgi:hypothetical protein
VGRPGSNARVARRAQRNLRSICAGCGAGVATPLSLKRPSVSSQEKNTTDTAAVGIAFGYFPMRKAALGHLPGELTPFQEVSGSARSIEASWGAMPKPPVRRSWRRLRRNGPGANIGLASANQAMLLSRAC